MAKLKWNEVTVKDVIEAIRIFELENPEYPEPRSTFLLFEGKMYPAKHIRGMAYRVHFGEEISKDSFSGGKETVRFFNQLGFDTHHLHNKNNHSNLNGNESKDIKIEPIHKQRSFESQTKTSERVVIPTKRVIEQKNALQLLLNKLCDGDIVCEKTYSWMKTPDHISNEYIAIYEAISAYRGNRNFAKKKVSLRCDFVCESRKLIIEYDERQHFSEARKVALLSYENVNVNFDKEMWIRACESIQAKDSQPTNRDEVRAFYDSVRDIEAAKHGYKLVRIMHGQIDFEQEGAMKQLASILGIAYECLKQPSAYIKPDLKNQKGTCFNPGIKIGLYLQTDELYNKRDVFDEAMDIVRNSNIDILVLPEFSYVPFNNEFENADYLNETELQSLYRNTIDLSRSIGRAIVICNQDRNGIIMSIYANAFAEEGETECKNYIKHTMTSYSAFEIESYPQCAENLFRPIIYKGYQIGLTICYDCNHSIFSRKYGLDDVDIILNSSGGDVVYDKWYKYNKARAIENKCFTFVTMGGSDNKKSPHNYVYGFTPTGNEMTPTLLNGIDENRHNVSGGIYMYDTAEDDGRSVSEPSAGQAESQNKNSDIFIPSEKIMSFYLKCESLINGIRIMKYKDMNVVFCLVEGDDIMKPEKTLKLLYAKELKYFSKKRYIIINKWKTVNEKFYMEQLSLILKVRSMENYCAVLLTASNIVKCYQCGQNRTAQVVKAENGQFGIDLSRTGGPETIWHNKDGMKAKWRNNIEWLIDSM